MPWTFDIEERTCETCGNPVLPVGPLTIDRTGDHYAIAADAMCGCPERLWSLGLVPVTRT